MISHRWALSSVLLLTAVLPLGAQSVISARSGVIHFIEGSVLLDNQPLEHRFGRFEQMKDGSELKTQDGRAEVMLTPGVFLRVGQNSTIRMISCRLAETRVEFLSGSTVLDSMEATGKVPVTMLYGGYQVRAERQGRYRFNSEPPELMVENGEAEVLLGSDSERVNAGQLVPLGGQLVSRQFADNTADALDSWNKTRNNSISEDNVTSAGVADLSTVVDGWENDPQAILRQMLSNYTPPLSPRQSVSGYGALPSSTYSPLSTSSPLSTYSPWLGSPMPGVLPFGIWGLGFPIGSSYASPYLRYNTYPVIGVPSYHPPLAPMRPGIGVSPVYQPRPPMPIHTAPGRIGHR